MSDLEQQLREWAKAQTAAAPKVTIDTRRFRSRVRATWLAPVAAAAAVIAVGASVLALQPWSTTHQATDAVGSSGSSTPGVHNGMRESVFHGLAIDVPAAWPDNATKCGTAQRNTLIYPSGSTPACAALRTAGITSVEWSAIPAAGATHGSTRAAGVVIGGYDATKHEGTAAQRGETSHVIWLDVPKLSAAVTITSPSLSLANRLYGTLRVVSHDQYNCDARTAISEFSDVPRPTRSGAGGALIPGDPTQISLCWYENGFLNHGARLNSHDSGTAVRLINGLPAGLSKANPRDFLPAVCQPNNQLSELNQVDIFVMRVDYPSGPSLTLVSRLAWCGELGVTNGQRNGQFRTSLWNFLIRHVGGPGGVPGRVVPVH